MEPVLKNTELIEQITKDIKQENQLHHLRFIFISDIGLRAYNLNLNDFKDIPYDIKGFYIGNQEDYLSVIRPPKELKITKEKKDQYKTKFGVNVDYEFLDIRTYLQFKIQLSKSYRDTKSTWLQSDLVYINDFSGDQLKALYENISYPLTPYWGKIKQQGIMKKKNPKAVKINDENHTNTEILPLLINVISVLQFEAMIKQQRYFFDTKELLKLEGFEKLNSLYSELINLLNQNQTHYSTNPEQESYQFYIQKIQEVAQLKNVEQNIQQKPEIEEQLADKIFQELMDGKE